MRDEIEDTLQTISEKPADPYHGNRLMRAIVGFVLGGEAIRRYKRTAQYDPDWRAARGVAREWLTLREATPQGTETIDRIMLSEMVEAVHGWSLDALDEGSRHEPVSHAQPAR